jgi:LysM repeat protein
LITLVGVVCLLLYVGWQMISDDASNASDLQPNTKVEMVDEGIADVNSKSVAAETKTAPVVANPTPEVSKSSVNSNLKTAIHVVSKGETLFSIATRYNLTIKAVTESNSNLNANNLKLGAKLSIPVLAIHTVGPGDILRVVGGKYGVTVKAIMRANAKDKNFSERGEKLIIPVKEKF